MAVRSVPDTQAQQQPATIPQLTTSPLWSVRPASVVVEAGGWEFEVSHRTAADWLEVLMAGEFEADAILPGMLEPADADVFEELVWDLVLSPEEAVQLSLDVLAAAAGRPWWVAMGIVASVRVRWDVVGGDLVLSGVVAENLTLSAWLDAAFTTCVRSLGRDQKALQGWLDRLAEPPEGVTRQEMDAGMDMRSFTAMM